MESKYGIFFANGPQSNYGPNGMTTTGLTKINSSLFNSLEEAQTYIEDNEMFPEGTGPYLILPVFEYRKKRSGF